MARRTDKQIAADTLAKAVDRLAAWDKGTAAMEDALAARRERRHALRDWVAFYGQNPLLEEDQLPLVHDAAPMPPEDAEDAPLTDLQREAEWDDANPRYRA